MFTSHQLTAPAKSGFHAAGRLVIRTLACIATLAALSGCETLSEISDYVLINTEVGNSTLLRGQRDKRIRVRHQERLAEEAERTNREIIESRGKCKIPGYPEIDYTEYGVLQEACRRGLGIHGFWVLESERDFAGQTIATRARNHTKSKDAPFDQLDVSPYEYLEVQCDIEGRVLVIFRGSPHDAETLVLNGPTKVRLKFDDNKHKFLDASGSRKAALVQGDPALRFIQQVYEAETLQIRIEPKHDYDFDLIGAQNMVWHLSQTCPATLSPIIQAANAGNVQN